MRRIAWFGLLWVSLLQAQVITTIAGTDPALSASGIPAISAPLIHATGVAVDGSGNLYIADTGSQIVTRVSADGTLTVIAGNGHQGFSGDGGPATLASLNQPFAIAVDSGGSVYIADYGNSRVRKVSGGTISTVAGNGSFFFSGDGGAATNAALAGPTSVALDTAGNLYIADYNNNRIRKVTGGTISTIAGTGNPGFTGDGGPAIQATLTGPEGIALDSAGNLYIADTFNVRIRKVSGGTISTVAGNGVAGYSGDGRLATAASLNLPRNVALDSRGNLFIGDGNNQVIREVSGGTITTVAGNGLSGALGDGGPATSGSISYPSGIAVDSGGALYIADIYNARVRKVVNGTITTVAGNGQGSFGGDGGPAPSALLSYPTAMAFDAAGNLYIADYYNHRVRKVSGGVITTVAGNGIGGFSGDGGPAAKAALDGPNGVAIDSAGNLYIADQFNNRIRRVTNGTITTIAGNGTAGFSGDGAAATNAALNNPITVAVDSGGNLYFADSLNHRVRKISQGIITTVAGSGVAGFSGDGGPATAARLNAPSAVAIDAAGNLFIADKTNNRVREVTAGNIRTVAGSGSNGFAGDGGPATIASLSAPISVAVDAAGNLYIADPGNSRIRKVAGGNITTVAGDGEFTFAGDGGLATAASLNQPYGVAVDSAGNLFIGDSNNNRVRAVLAAKPTYTAAPGTLGFTGSAGGAVTSGQVINLSSAVPGLPFTVSTSASWLTVTPLSGTIPAAIQVTADPSALGAGNVQGSVSVVVSNASPSTITVPVTFTVQPATAPTLAVDTQTMSFTAIQGQGALSQVLNVVNSGGGQIAFTASAATTSGGSWLAVSPAAGTATPSAPTALTASATPGSLAPGTYSGTITVSSAAQSIVIPVSLSVSAPSASTLLSQSALSYNAVAQGGVPLPKSFAILNTGQGTLNWTAKAATLSGGNWLQITPGSGTVQRPFLDASLVNVSVDGRTLTAGTYYGRIEVAASAANTPQILTVILTVLPAGSKLPPEAYPLGLIFTGTAGVTPPPQDVQLANPTGAELSFVSGITGAGLDYLPKGGVVEPPQPTTVRVYPDFTRLAPGTIQRGAITLQFSDGSAPQTITVLTVVSPGSAGTQAARAKGAQPAASSCPISIVFRQPQPAQTTFNAVVGQSTTIEAQISDCNSLVGPNGTGSAQLNFSSGKPLAMNHIGNGIWQANWKPLSAGTISLTIVALEPVQGGGTLGGQSATVTAVVSAPGANGTPTVSAQNVVHSASGVVGAPISPGGLISIYGQNLADGASQSNGLPLPEQLNGTQVLLGDQPLPILYANPVQVNVQVPYGVPVNTQYQLSVQRGVTYSVPEQLVVAQAQPGIFTVNQQGFGQASIVKSDGVTLAQPGTPATIGETIVIYCTGLGPVTPKVTEGSPPLADPLSKTDNAVTVTIGGKPAAVSFSGLTPGDPGLYQINAVVPSGITAGDAVPVVISVAGQTSPIIPAVTIAVK
ncbi:MAG TPA: hypothetical protein VKU19_28375 [Bryobacteraceae bacterium]|nr:hypothetical protein [Bryobacteraceae bacterium]